MKYWFTADEHYGHSNIIKFCNRPFSTVEEMDKAIIDNHNALVQKGDIVVHGGDFTLGKDANKYIEQLRGSHIFIKGSHDRWMDKNSIQIWERTIEGIYVVVCHYAMRVWPRSHYGSWQLFAHSHGNLEPIGNQHDIGVDNNNFCPASFNQIRDIMDSKCVVKM